MGDLSTEPSSGRVQLRRVQPGDERAILKLLSNELVVRYMLFRREGHHQQNLRIHGTWRDSYTYAIRASACSVPRCQSCRFGAASIDVVAEAPLESKRAVQT